MFGVRFVGNAILTDGVEGDLSKKVLFVVGEANPSPEGVVAVNTAGVAESAVPPRVGLCWEY